MTETDNKKIANLDKPPAALTDVQIHELSKEIPDWEVVIVDETPHLRRTFTFKNFVEALGFTNKIGEIAENHGHHPLIELTWGRVIVEWWSHDLGGLQQNDFTMAAETSKLYQS